MQHTSTAWCSHACCWFWEPQPALGGDISQDLCFWVSSCVGWWSPSGYCHRQYLTCRWISLLPVGSSALWAWEFLTQNQKAQVGNPQFHLYWLNDLSRWILSLLQITEVVIASSVVPLFPPYMPSFSPPFPIIGETWPIVHENLFTLLDISTYKSPRSFRPASTLINVRTRINTQPLVSIYHLGYQDVWLDAGRTNWQHKLTLYHAVRPCHIMIDDSRFVTQFCGVNIIFGVQTKIVIASEVTRNDPVIVSTLSLAPWWANELTLVCWTSLLDESHQCILNKMSYTFSGLSLFCLCLPAISSSLLILSPAKRPHPHWAGRTNVFYEAIWSTLRNKSLKMNSIPWNLMSESRDFGNQNFVRLCHLYQGVKAPTSKHYVPLRFHQRDIGE